MDVEQENNGIPVKAGRITRPQPVCPRRGDLPSSPEPPLGLTIIPYILVYYDVVIL